MLVNLQLDTLNAYIMISFISSNLDICIYELTHEVGSYRIENGGGRRHRLRTIKRRASARRSFKKSTREKGRLLTVGSRPTRTKRMRGG